MKNRVVWPGPYEEFSGIEGSDIFQYRAKHTGINQIIVFETLQGKAARELIGVCNNTQPRKHNQNGITNR